MEKQLFDWNKWNGDHDCMIFYNPVLKIQIGKYPSGTKFDSAIIMIEPEKGILQFYNKSGPEVKGFSPTESVAEYNLKLSIDSIIKE